MLFRQKLWKIIFTVFSLSTLLVMACASEKETITVIETVVVEKAVEVERVVVATATTTAEERASAALGAKKGGHLRISSVGSVQSFDPLWTTASSTGNVSSLILVALFAYKEDNTIGKMLVDDWKVSSDGLKWTFKIRDGVQFHNAVPIKPGANQALPHTLNLVTD